MDRVWKTSALLSPLDHSFIRQVPDQALRAPSSSCEGDASAPAAHHGPTDQTPLLSMVPRRGEKVPGQGSMGSTERLPKSRRSRLRHFPGTTNLGKLHKGHGSVPVQIGFLYCAVCNDFQLLIRHLHPHHQPQDLAAPMKDKEGNKGARPSPPVRDSPLRPLWALAANSGRTWLLPGTHGAGAPTRRPTSAPEPGASDPWVPSGPTHSRSPLGSSPIRVLVPGESPEIPWLRRSRIQGGSRGVQGPGAWGPAGMGSGRSPARKLCLLHLAWEPRRPGSPALQELPSVRLEPPNPGKLVLPHRVRRVRGVVQPPAGCPRLENPGVRPPTRRGLSLPRLQKQRFRLRAAPGRESAGAETEQGQYSDPQPETARPEPRPGGRNQDWKRGGQREREIKSTCKRGNKEKEQRRKGEPRDPRGTPGGRHPTVKGKEKKAGVPVFEAWILDLRLLTTQFLHSFLAGFRTLLSLCSPSVLPFLQSLDALSPYHNLQPTVSRQALSLFPQHCVPRFLVCPMSPSHI
ncbi:uncharacterized protein LOC111719491 [Sarcophilus harrisii]|uniref:uncharacterized protein LOC111719491 n=1 Tax=Sarcophilus harrisii TaxID=9305 RepID=UPI001301B2E4|nr:uncharacterized protein LOC111719491 [Sarcophilus harrisii]